MSKGLARNLIIAVIVAAAAVYVFGNGSVALWDRDEPRYAQTSRQMLASGDWVVPHYLDMIRTAKPAAIYWCQAAAMSVFGVNSFAARFPSSASIVILLIVLAIVLWKHVDPLRAAWTVFVLATAALTIASAKMCITDALLLLWVTISQICLYAAWRGRATWPVVIVWAVAVGLAGLTKGPVVLGMQITTVIALGAISLWNRITGDADAASDDFPLEGRFPVGTGELSTALGDRSAGVSPVSGNARHGRDARATDHTEFPLATAADTVPKLVAWLLIVTAVVLPWILMVNHRAVMAASNSQSGSFIGTQVKHEVWDRMMTPLEQHSGPPGYYFLAVWATFFPWSLLLPLAVVSGFVRRADPRLRFALAAVIGPWIMLECFRTKLPFYFLPAFPPLAYLVGDAIVRTIQGELADLRGKLFVTVVGAWSVLVVVLSLGPWIMIRVYSPIAIIIVLNVIAIGFAAVVWTAFLRRRVLPGLIGMGFGTLLIVAGFYGLYLPGADFLRVSPRVAKILTDHKVTGDHQVLMIGYAEPTLAFYQGGTIREGGKIGFVRGNLNDFTPWLVVPRPMFDAAPADLRDRFDVVDHVFGLAYADRGKWEDVLVLHRREPGHG